VGTTPVCRKRLTKKIRNNSALLHAAGTGADVMVGAASRLSAPTANVLARGASQHFTWV